MDHLSCRDNKWHYLHKPLADILSGLGKKPHQDLSLAHLVYNIMLTHRIMAFLILKVNLEISYFNPIVLYLRKLIKKQGILSSFNSVMAGVFNSEFLVLTIIIIIFI